MSDGEDRKLELIVEEAASWHVRLKDNAATTYERLEYLQWLKESPVHVAEALRMRNLGELLHGAKPNKLQRDATVSAQWWRSAATWKLIAAFVAFALLVLAVLILNIANFDRSNETQVGQWRDPQLTEGSTARRDPRTNLRYD